MLKSIWLTYPKNQAYNITAVLLLFKKYYKFLNPVNVCNLIAYFYKLPFFD